MNMFTWLLLGHFVGDWILQNDWMAKGKKKALLTPAGMVHFTIYTFTIMGALWLSGVTDTDPMFYLTIGIVVFLSHWLVDATNMVEWWMRAYRQSDLEIVKLMVDQVLHLLLLSAVIVWLVEV